MNALTVFAAVLAVACAAPVEQGVSLTQDTLGNYNLKYVTAEAQRNEQGFEGGKVMGSYSYTDDDGHHHKITYLAAPHEGFIAHGDLPTQVVETPEVAHARAVHLAIVEKERALLPPLKEDYEHHHHQEHVVFVPATHPVAPVVHHHHYVDNTAELDAARAEHFAAHHDANARLAEAYRKVTSHF